METFVDRARVIMARIKDDTSPLESKASPTIALKYADAFIKVFRKDLLQDENGVPVDISTISNAIKATVYIDRLRIFHKDVFTDSRITPVADTARNTEKGIVDTEFTNELGIKEEIITQ